MREAPHTLLEAARAVEMSAAGHGTSNKSVARFAKDATERIMALENQVLELESRLNDMMEANGLWSGR